MISARQTTVWALALALCSASIVGCHHVDPPTEESDGGDDDDTGTDTEQDSYSPPTDTSEGYCQEEPVYCSDVGPTPMHQYMGCCYDGALYWCWEQDQIWVDSIDCELNGGTCGYDPLSEWMDCLYD